MADDVYATHYRNARDRAVRYSNDTIGDAVRDYVESRFLGITKTSLHVHEACFDAFTDELMRRDVCADVLNWQKTGA